MNVIADMGHVWQGGWLAAVELPQWILCLRKPGLHCRCPTNVDPWGGWKASAVKKQSRHVAHGSYAKVVVCTFPLHIQAQC